MNTGNPELYEYGGWTKLKGKATGVFHTEYINDRWWFVDPEGCAFLSLGINHIDHSSLMYTDNISVWEEKYHSSVEEWILKGVVRDFEEWGFNTNSWTQEVVTDNSIHCTEWTHDMHKISKIPYCHRRLEYPK